MQNPKSEFQYPKWAALGVAAWLAALLAFFFSLPLPNNPSFVRWHILVEVPELLLSHFSTEAAGDAPSGAPDAVHSGWRYFPQRFDFLGIAAIILAGAWGAGNLVLRIIRAPSGATALERTVFAFGIGLAALSLATLGAGLAGWLSRLLLGGLIALFFTAECALRLRSRISFPPFVRGGLGGSRGGEIANCKSDEGETSSLDPESEIRNPKSRLSLWLILASLVPFLLAMLLGALLPSIDFDVNEYHFEGPKEFYQAGRISFLPHNVYTSFPFCTEMLTLLAMVLRGDWYRGALAGKCVLMVFGPLTGLALFAAGRRWFGTTAGVMAAFLYLTTPWVYKISTIAYAEGGLCFYLFASVMAFMMAVGAEVPPSGREPSEGGTPMKGLLLAGLFAGSAMACKYPGALSVIIPLFAAAVWIALFGGITQRAAPQIAVVPAVRFARWIMPAMFALGTLLAVGPWLAKNAVETCNPVYPLLYRLLDGHDWDGALDAKWTKAHSPATYALSSLADLAIDVAVRNDWVNPLLFGLAPVALLAAGARRRTGGLWAYVGWLFFTCWLFTHRIDRFWVPMIPVVALLAGAGGAWWWSALDDALGRATAAVVISVPLAVIGFFQLAFITTRLCGYNDYLRDLDEAARFAAQHTDPEVVYLNKHLPVGSKVLSVGDAMMFESKFPVIYNTVFDHSIFEEWLAARPGEPSGPAGLRDAMAIRNKLTEEKVTHIYVCWREILRYRSPGNYGYTDFVTPERFAELERLGILGKPWPIPNSVMDLSDLDAGRREELETWGRALMVQSGDRRGFVTFQVFPVLDPDAP